MFLVITLKTEIRYLYLEKKAKLIISDTKNKLKNTLSLDNSYQL